MRRAKDKEVDAVIDMCKQVYLRDMRWGDM